MAVLDPSRLVEPLGLLGHPYESQTVGKAPRDVDGELVVRHQPLVGVDERYHYARVIPNVCAVYNVTRETDAMVIA